MAISVDKLQLEISDNSEKAVRGIDKLSAALERLRSVSGIATPSLDKFSKSTEKLSDNNKKVTSSFREKMSVMTQTIAKYSVLYYGVARLARVFGDLFRASNEFTETLNFTAVVFGDLYDKTVAYAQKVQDLMGIDMGEWLSANATFMQIATGFGIAADKAQLMSVNLTQLAYDLSSLRNTTIKDAINATASAITGQTKPLLRYGISVHKATLEETALAHGITKRVSLMNNAEKAMLRYIQIFEASGNAKLDLNRTINTPANALRILNSQFIQLKRALGGLISVFAVRLIPYVQAFIRLATEGGNRLAKMFGFEIPKIDYSGITDLFSDTEEEVQDTESAVKSLKRQLMGFDELNIMSSQKSDSTGGLGAGAGTTPLDIELPSYIDDFLKGLDKNLDPYIEKIKKIAKIAEVVGISFLSWKLAKSFLTNLDFLSTTLPKFFKFSESIKELMTKLMAKLGLTNLMVAMIAATVAIVVGRFIDLYRNNEDFRVGLERTKDLAVFAFGVIKDVVVGLGKAIIKVGGFMLDLLIPDALEKKFRDTFKKISKMIENLGLDWKDYAIIATAAVLFLIPGGQVFAGILLVFEGITIGIRELGKAFKDTTKPIEIFQDDISKLTKTKCEPFIKEMESLDKRFKELDWGNSIITETDVADIEARVKKISDTILNELSSDRNEALKNLEPLKSTMDSKTYDAIVNKTGKYYDDMAKEVEDGEKRINEIIATAYKENRKTTETEEKEIDKIKSQMLETGIQHLSENEVEYTTIMRRLKDNSKAISLEQASEIIKNAMKTRDESVKAAEEQYSKTLLAAEQMHDVGAINDTEYQAMIDGAKELKDETVKSAEEQYSSIYNTATTELGKTAKYIDEETGGIKSDWDVFLTGLSTDWNSFWAGLGKVWEGWNTFWFDVGVSAHTAWESIKTKFREEVAPYLTKEYWKNKFWSIVDGAKEALDELWKRFTNWSATIKVPHMEWTSKELKKNNPVFKVLDALGLPTALPNLDVKWYADGGFPDAGQLFVAREAGAEMVGSINGKTAVANNDQIVQGIKSGVYEGVLSAMRSSGGNGNGKIIVKVESILDGQKVGQGVAEWNNGIVKQGRPSPLLV